MPRPRREPARAGQVRDLADVLASELALAGGITRSAWHSRVSRNSKIKPHEAALMLEALDARLRALRALREYLLLTADPDEYERRRAT